MMLRRFALLCFLLFGCGLWAAAADPKVIYDQSTDALYNLDFNTAQQGYETLTREYPENPDYWNALASSLLLRIMYEQEKLSLESFSGSSLGTSESRDAVNAKEEKRLRDTVDIAISKSDAILKKNPRDIRALYAKGISNATLASFEASVKRSYMAAGRKAKAARDLHQEVLKLDSSLDDARMSVGMFNYVVAVIPGSIRWMLSLLGFRSAGKEIGIEQLETAAAKGKSVGTDARMMLIVVYNRERRYEKAINFATELHNRYPRNFIFELARASIYGKMKRWDDALRTYQEVLAKVEEKKNGYERLAAYRVQHSLGTTNIERHQFESAISNFDHVVKFKDSPPDAKASALLWMGKIHDSAGRRAQALQQYDAILALNCNSEFKSQAQQFKKRPFK